ncbi:hypothetical protein CaCOL14_009547 [Colletotrichum acutatum]
MNAPSMRGSLFSFAWRRMHVQLGAAYATFCANEKLLGSTTPHEKRHQAAGIFCWTEGPKLTIILGLLYKLTAEINVLPTLILVIGSHAFMVAKAQDYELYNI